MKKFYILETQRLLREVTWGHCLIGLREVINEIGSLDVDYWLLQDIWQSGAYDFNLGNAYAELTKNEPKGLCVSPEDFQINCNSVVQVIDGTLIAINSKTEEEPLLVLDAFDSSTWHLATSDELIGERLIKCGWEKSLYFPRLRGFPDWVNKFKENDDVVKSGVEFID